MGLTRPAFTCDCMLGRLAKKLRMLGLDTLYIRDDGAEVLGSEEAQRGRILLTRRTAVLKKMPAQPRSVIFIHHDEPDRQVREVLDACSITPGDTAPFSRCLRCNAPLEPVPKHDARGRVPEYIFATVAWFASCPRCGGIFWRGSHREAMLHRLSDLKYAKK